MKPRTRFASRTRLVVEQLESRWCPALSASLSDGLLTISGTADNGSINVVQDSAAAGTINVMDGTTAVTGSPFTGVTAIQLSLTGADDVVTVDLGGQTLAGKVSANLGAGLNRLSVLNGVIEGNLSVSPEGSSGESEGGGSGSCGAGRGFRLGRGPSRRAKAHSTESSGTTDTGTNTVTLAAGATANNVSIRSGLGGTTVDIAGSVTGDLVVNAFSRSDPSAGATVSVSGEVDGRVFFLGSSLDDALSISGTIGQSVSAHTYGGADKVTIGGAVTGALSLNTGAGNDQVAISNTVVGKVVVSTGAGNDDVSIASPANFLERAIIRLGAGTDTFSLDDAASFATLIANGGTGTDSFVGTQPRTGLTLISF